MREVAIRHGSNETTRRRGGKARRQGDEVTRRRGDEARRRDGETTTATGMMNDAHANDDQNGIEQATVGPHRGFRLKQRGNDTMRNSGGEFGGRLRWHVLLRKRYM